jgi:hypothetical protein
MIASVRCNLCGYPYYGLTYISLPALVVMFRAYLDVKRLIQDSSYVRCKVKIQETVRLEDPSYSLSAFELCFVVTSGSVFVASGCV